jgi:hypothetical protein
MGTREATNNHAEALAVYMGLCLIPVSRSSKLVVMGDCYRSVCSLGQVA